MAGYIGNKSSVTQVDGYTREETDALLDSIEATNLKDSSNNIVVDTSSGNMVLADNKKAVFGDGSDLQIYHDGTDSYVSDQGTGNLVLQGTNLRLQNSTNTDYLYAANGGAVSIAYGGAYKLATTSTGVDVTGDIYLNGGGTSARLWTQANESGMNYGGNALTHVWMDNAWFREATWGAERSWDNYPGITATNDTREGPIGEFRIHGINGVSGGDFSVATRCDGGFITGSDARHKTNISSISNALDTVKQLDGKTFNIVNRDLNIESELSMAGGRKFGFIAQDIETVIPEAVKYNPESEVLDNGWASAYAVDYGTIVALLTNAIKEQQVQIEELRNKVTSLEGV